MNALVRLVKTRWWELRYTLIAWRRWRCSLRFAWQAATATDEPVEDRETPREAIETEESYADIDTSLL